MFFKLLNKQFLKTSNLQIFNRNDVKLTYCCTNNLDIIIKKHNTRKFKIAENSNSTDTFPASAGINTNALWKVAAMPRAWYIKLR